MKRSTIALFLTASMMLAGCMGDGGATVTRNYTGSATCSNMSGVSAIHMQGTAATPVRCGPQRALPYTMR